MKKSFAGKNRIIGIYDSFKLELRSTALSDQFQYHINGMVYSESGDAKDGAIHPHNVVCNPLLRIPHSD